MTQPVNMDYSPIDYDAIRSSLDFSGMSPEGPRTLVAPELALTVVEPTQLGFQAIGDNFGADYARTTQVLSLPP